MMFSVSSFRSETTVLHVSGDWREGSNRARLDGHLRWERYWSHAFQGAFSDSSAKLRMTFLGSGRCHSDASQRSDARAVDFPDAVPEEDVTTLMVSRFLSDPQL